MSENINRRNFIGAGSAAVIIPSHVLAAGGNTPPSDRINIAYIGCGTQGLRQLMQLLPRRDVRVVAVCDPNKDSSDYIEWGKNEIRNKVRNFLNNPGWGSGNTGCRCGRYACACRSGLEVMAWAGA